MDIIIAAQDSAVLQRFNGLAKVYGEPIGVSRWGGLTAALDQSEPGLVIVDTLLLRDDPAQRLSEIFSSIHGVARLVLLTADFDRDEDLLTDALLRGAMGCLRLSLGDEMAQQALGIVHAGESWVDRHLLSRLLQRCAGYSKSAVSQSDNAETKEASGSRGKLTLREREILQQIVSGKSNKDIARALDISERTVKAHLTAIYRKLEVVDRVKLILLMQGRIHHVE